jgi:hypothetical protein
MRFRHAESWTRLGPCTRGLPRVDRSSTTPLGSAENGDALEFGFDYLEKFIQLPYHLPEPSTDGIQTFLSR